MFTFRYMLNRCFCLLLAAITLFTIRAAAEPAIHDTALLRREIMAIYAQHPQATFALAFQDMQTGEQFFINEHQSFHAASTMKTPVLIETFRQIAQHTLSLRDSILN